MRALIRGVGFSTLVQAGLIIVAFVTTLVFAPHIEPFSARLGDYPSIHLLLEMFAVSISLMVVAVAWHGLSQRELSSANTLIAFFTVVGVTDTWHALVYQGMPGLVQDADAQLAIYFWLVARVVESVGILLIAAGVRLPGTRGRWLVIGLTASLAVVVFILTRRDALPVMFVAGTGVTSLKAGIEYTLFAANLLLAAALYWIGVRDRSQPTLLLSRSCFAIALGSLAFARYTDVNDLVNLGGHLLKIVGYSYVFRATLCAGITEPYEKLKDSELALRNQQEETNRVLEDLPIGIARFDHELRYRYLNRTHAASLKQERDAVIGRKVSEVVSGETCEQAEAHLRLAISGQRADYALEYPLPGTETGVIQVTVLPDQTTGSDRPGAFAIFLDTTESARAQRLAAESMKEVGELKAALDAHAIVAVADASGVITRVNDKFCTVSQYARSELYGHTHKVVNSGYHDRAFFRDMWHTITRGQVWNGEICNRTKDGTPYWLHTTIVPMIGVDGIPARYIAISTDISKRVLAEQEAARIALHDPLTGLPNRRLMTERLERSVAAASGSRSLGALLLLDLDEFKEVNDTLGHASGDQLLKQVGNRLLRLAGRNDTVARLGGDEFVVALEGLGQDIGKTADVASDYAERIRAIIAIPYLLSGQDVNVTCSIGVVLFGKEPIRTDELLKQAELALYKSKGIGRNTATFYDPAQQAEVSERAGLLRDLRVAIERNELALHYQTVVNGERRVVGVEALLRWRHPVRGEVPPMVFISIAEKSGLILDIGNWVLAEACRQLHTWADDPARSRWTIAVNVSARQFHESDFVARVEQALEAADARATHLRLEVTESMLQADLNQTIGKMHTLRQLGVRFALDDFGTGYSSLSYLKRMPIDQLKIDKSFVADILTDGNSSAIARTVLTLARSLDLSVVAEGVETEAQFYYLADLGCAEFQGFLISRPAPADTLADS